MSTLFSSAEPVVPVRAVHLDLKGVPPTAERLCSLLKVLAAFRYNAAVVEWEDSFPWSDRRFRSPTAYSPEDVRRFALEAARLEIEIIPLVQCLGHMETPLRPEENRPLREVANRSDALNPLAPGARDLVQSMVDDVLRLLPEVRRFHLGGDEAWSFGSHPDTKAYIEKHGKGSLYLHHVEPILDNLLARGIRPILWHDMMRDWDGDALRRLAPKADLCTWIYGGSLEQWGAHCGEPIIRRFVEHGFALWAGTAYKGADGYDADLPNPQARIHNALAWAKVAKESAFVGAIATAWSRYSTNTAQCEPIDAALDCLACVGVILHDAQPPAGGMDACRDALDSIGERARFDACRAAMASLAAARSAGWTAVKNLRQQIALETLDPARRGTSAATACLNGLRSALRDADNAAAAVRQAFAGLIEPHWIDQYLGERIIPLQEELSELAPRAAALEPEAQN